MRGPTSGPLVATRASVHARWLLTVDAEGSGEVRALPDPRAIGSVDGTGPPRSRFCSVIAESESSSRAITPRSGDDATL
jgi:hypothetical protein